MTMGSVAESGGLRNGKNDMGAKDHLDAGAVFVLESKGNWLHAGYHLTTSIVAPALLSLPFAFAALGWFAGIVFLIVGAAVTFYSYNLLSLVLERLESEGNRHLRFRDMARDILGPRWARFTVAPIQFAVCMGSVIGSILFGGQSLKATLSPPVSGKMFKGLCICYTVVVSTFFSVAVSGYWAFGNRAAGNIFNNFAHAGREPSVVPNWLLFTANICVLFQLFAVALVYSQPTFEVLEGKSGDASNGRFSPRNLIPRLLLRSVYVSVATLIAAMLPFCADILAVIGAFGFMPLDFVFPVLFYGIKFKPSKRSLVFWINTLIALIFSLLGGLGCIAAIRQISVDANSYKLFANL